MPQVLAGRTLAIGDIHGCSRALDAVLSMAGFRDTDRLVTLGDYVDRGPDSRGVIERLIALQASGQLVALRGNHEIMMMQARSEPDMEQMWLRVGGQQTLESYNCALEDVPASHWEFIEESCLSYWEDDTHLFVHAGAYPDMALFDQPDDVLFWGRFNYPAPHVSGKILVCGHTSQKSGLPINLGHAVCLDTWAYGRGWLSCMDTTSGRLWQASQSGEAREMWLDDV